MTPLPEWTRRYIGLPWAPGGSDFGGVDCWGLLRLVLAEECGVAVPNYGALHPAPGLDRCAFRAEVARLMQERLNDWQEIAWPDAQVFDGVHVPLAGEYCHVAILAGPDQALHVTAGMTNVEAMDLAGPHWRDRRPRMRVYRRRELIDGFGLNRAAGIRQGAPWTAR